MWVVMKQILDYISSLERKRKKVSKETVFNGKGLINKNNNAITL